MTNESLVSIEQKTVTFYDDELIAIRAEDGWVYVAIRQMCEALGLNQRSQRRRIQNHAILSSGYTRGDISTPPSSDGRGGGIQSAGMLRVDLVPLWLAGIQAGKASAHVQGKLIQYQKEASIVLWDAFREGRLTSGSVHDEIMLSDSPSAVAYRLAEEAEQRSRAIKAIALQQYKHEQRLVDHENRLETIEAQLGNPEHLITNAQAERISQAVKAVALELGRRSGKNEHGGVYGEVYRTYSITSYKELPASRYNDCMKMLTDWYNSLVDGVVF